MIHKNQIQLFIPQPFRLLQQRYRYKVLILLLTYILLASVSDCQCTPNTSGCLVCANTFDCSICASQYYLQIQYCSPCPNGCFQCFSTNFCFSCLTGYALVNNMCQACPLNCISCTNSSNCQTCLNGFFVNQNNGTNCNPCVQFCLECNSSETCTLCMAYYGINTTINQCQFCALGTCLSCQITFNEVNCINCQAGYYVNQSKCESCSIGCSTCSDFNGACTSCQSSYYLNTTIQQCESCSDDCLTCTNSTYCTTCFRRYIVKAANGNFICGGECQSPYCIICQNYTFCNKCIVGGPFVQNYQTGKCQLCGNFLEGCVTCNSTTICTSCDYNYFINTYNNTCISCPSACEQCTSLTQCSSCISNQYSLSNNVCSLCLLVIPNCVLCTGAQCNQCLLGYKLVGQTCLGDQLSIGAIWIVLIAFTVLILLIGVGITIYTWCKKRNQLAQFSQHVQDFSQNNRSGRPTYIQMS